MALGGRPPPSVAEDYFGIGGTHEGGGSIIITHAHEHWRSRPILVIPFHTPRLPPELGGLPSIMELLAITGGLEVLATLGLTGTIYSDCQGLIRKLLHPHLLRRNTTGSGFPPTLQHHPIQLNWTRSHPERSNVPPNCWDQNQWGIFLADRFGGPQPPDYDPDFPTLHRFSPISHQTIAEGTTKPHHWVWSAMGPAPLLGSLTRALHHTALHTYTEHLEDSRAQREAPPKWGGVSALHGAAAWQLTKKEITRNNKIIFIILT